MATIKKSAPKIVTLQVSYEDASNTDCDGPKVTVKVAEGDRPVDVQATCTMLDNLLDFEKADQKEQVNGRNN